MKRAQVYLPRKELDALRQAAARSGRSMSSLVREAIRQVILEPRSGGPVALWDGQPTCSAVDHDTIYDNP